MSIIVLHDTVPHKHVLIEPVSSITCHVHSSGNTHSHSACDVKQVGDHNYVQPFHNHQKECSFSHLGLLVVDKISTYIPTTGIFNLEAIVELYFNSNYSTSKILKGFSFVFKLRGPPFIYS